MKAALAALFLLGAAPAFAGDVTATRILSGDTLQLSDGRVLRLEGVKAVGPRAQEYLQASVGHELVLQDAVTDRYGRVAALVAVAGQQDTLQDALVRQGLAFVYPALGGEARLDAMLAEESAARARKAGYWADHSDTPAAEAGNLIGRYGFVSGKILQAARVKNKVYLNFGADWRSDFTIAIAAHDLRAFKKAGIDPLALAGKNVRVRGWVKRDFGPMVTITDPHQIEIME
ncbi:MAG: thermonuclease family protein [Alphaproteobacteria bacterium]|nr:thermonuclease family protein [Alphaproteobacteria bacterium]